MASISLQDLRRRLYVEAKADKTKRFWGLYVHVAKLETLRAAYDLAKRNNGAPGIDGVTFDAVEAGGLELVEQAYVLDRNDGLVGKGFEERDMPLGEGYVVSASDAERSDRLPLAKQGNGKNASDAHSRAHARK